MINKDILEFYRPYIERNKTFEAFAEDVNTLGFANGKLDLRTDKKYCYSTTVERIPLKEIYNGQQALL